MAFPVSCTLLAPVVALGPLGRGETQLAHDLESRPPGLCYNGPQRVIGQEASTKG